MMAMTHRSAERCGENNAEAIKTSNNVNIGSSTITANARLVVQNLYRINQSSMAEALEAVILLSLCS